MDVSERINITLHIYDTNISVSVPREDEELWRKAAQLIDERMNDFFGKYKNSRVDTEIRYYVMLDIALKYISEARHNDIAPITNILSRLSSDIDEVLK
jgi:cell division protein ZapA